MNSVDGRDTENLLTTAEHHCVFHFCSTQITAIHTHTHTNTCKSAFVFVGFNFAHKEVFNGGRNVLIFFS